MLERVSLTYFVREKDPTYVRLTLEFLSSFSYTIEIMIANSAGLVCFRMFHKEYTFDHNVIFDMFHFTYGEGVVCETPLDTDWVYEVRIFLEQLTGSLADSFEGNNATHIHNPTIRYFFQILA